MKQNERVRLVKQARERITKLTKKKDEIYNRLLKKLGLFQYPGSDDHIFDHVFNNYGTAKRSIQLTDFPR